MVVIVPYATLSRAENFLARCSTIVSLDKFKINPRFQKASDNYRQIEFITYVNINIRDIKIHVKV